MEMQINRSSFRPIRNAAALVLLQGVDTALAGALATLNRDGPGVIALLGTAAETFTSQAAISETLRDLEMQLIAECPADVSSPPAGALAAHLAAHRARYTMDAERKIHEKMFGADVALAPAVEETEEVDVDDIFF